MKKKNAQNPYIAGSPIENPELFFGRKELFYFIEDNLRQEAQVILLNGQRRIGKSSILKQIPHKINPEKYVFVDFDLQNKTKLSLNKILHYLVEEIIDCLELFDLKEEYKLINSQVVSNSILPKIYKQLEKKKLVLLLDEFDLLDEDNSNQKVHDFFYYLKSILEKHKQLVLIPVVGRRPDEMPKFLSLFKEALYYEIDLLDTHSAKELIIQPARSILEYQSEAIEAILKLSGNHPYFIQAICFTLFRQVREENRRVITCVEVEKIIDKVIEFASAGLAWFRNGLPVSERVVFSAIAKSQKLANSDPNNIIKNPLTLLEEHGVYLTQSIYEAVDRLINWHLIEPVGDQEYFSGINLCYKIKINMVFHWLVQRHSLREEIRELENIDYPCHSIYQATIALPQQNQEIAKILYEQILRLNPNHFSSLFELAEIYFISNNFEQAVELYERAYQVDSFKNKEGYVHSLDAYAHDLMMKEDLDEAEKLYQKLYDIHDNSSHERQRIQGQLKLIEKQKSNLKQKSWQFVKGYFIGWKGVTVSGLFIMFGLMGVGYWWFELRAMDGIKEDESYITKKLPGKSFYVPKWQPELFSRGQQPLFRGIDNINRDRGIEAFKKQDYPNAVRFFKKARVANRNDPEVLIYYNNSQARKEYNQTDKKTRPLTLAVIVPIDKNKNDAHEILRGVAQAQDQFNNSGGLDGQLLEIVIVNNSIESNKSDKVAQEIIKDSSIKGIIAQNTSIFNESAIKLYQKNDLAIISLTDLRLTNNNALLRISPSEKQSGRKLAEYIINELSLRRVVIYSNPNSSYSQNLEQGFKERFEKELEGKIVRTIDVSDPQLDTEKEVLVNINKDKVSAALLFPDSQYVSVAIEIIRENALHIDKKLRFLGSDTLYSHATLVAGGADVEGLTLAVPWFAKTEQSKNFSVVAKKQWGGEVNWRTAISFDATKAFIKAFSLSGVTSRLLVREKLQEVDLPASETSGDGLKFDDNGERITEPILVKVVKDNIDTINSELRFELVDYQK